MGRDAQTSSQRQDTGAAADTIPYELRGPSNAPNIPNFPAQRQEVDDAAAALRLPNRGYTRDERLQRYAEVSKNNFITQVDRYVAMILADPTKSEDTKRWAQDVQTYAHSDKVDRDFDRWMGNYQNLKWNSAVALEQEIRKSEGYLRSLERVIGVENLPSGKGMDERFAEYTSERARRDPLILQKSSMGGQHFIDLPDGWSIKVTNGTGTSGTEPFSVDISGGRRRYYLSGVNASSIVEVTNSTSRDPFSIQMGVRPHGNKGDFVLARAIGSEGQVSSSATQPVSLTTEAAEPAAPPSGLQQASAVAATATAASRFRVPFAVFGEGVGLNGRTAPGRGLSTELAENPRGTQVGATRTNPRGSITVSVEGAAEVVVFEGEFVRTADGGLGLKSRNGAITPCEVDISNAPAGAKVSIEVKYGDQVRTALGEVALDANGKPYVKFNTAPEAAPVARTPVAVETPRNGASRPALENGTPQNGTPRRLGATESTPSAENGASRPAAPPENGLSRPATPPEQAVARPTPAPESNGLIRRPAPVPEVRGGGLALPEAPAQTGIIEVPRTTAVAVPQPQAANVPIVVEPAGPPSLIASNAPRPPRFAWMESIRGQSSRLAGNPHFQNTALLVGLVGVHNMVAGDYRPDARHDIMPQFTKLFGKDALTDDFLKQNYGIDTAQSTRETGVVKAWAMDTTGQVADGVGVYAIIAGTTHYAGGAAAVPFLTVGATPFIGYAFTSGGHFIRHDHPAWDVGLSMAVPIAGAGVGGTAGTIGGPLAPITVPVGAGVGAILSTAGATVGMFTAVGNVIQQNKESIEEGAVRDTLARAEQGWERGASEPNNPVSEVARNYIEKLAKADFMQRAIKDNQEHKSQLPFSSDNWSENWDNIDTVIQEIKDYRDRKSYWWGAPLSRFSTEDRDRLLSIYSQVFEEKDGMLKAATRGYQRTFLVERHDTSQVGAWGQFFGADKSEASGVSWKDDFARLGTDFERQFRAREESIRAMDQSSEGTKQAKADLQVEEINWLRGRFPRIADYLTSVTNRNILESNTSPMVNGAHTRESFLMQSFAVSDVIQRIDRGTEVRSFYAELDKQIKDPAFQQFVLNTLTNERAAGETLSPREKMARHFSGEQPLSEEELNTYLRAILEHAASGPSQPVAQLPPA